MNQQDYEEIRMRLDAYEVLKFSPESYVVNRKHYYTYHMWKVGDDTIRVVGYVDFPFWPVSLFSVVGEETTDDAILLVRDHPKVYKSIKPILKERIPELMKWFKENIPNFKEEEK